MHSKLSSHCPIVAFSLSLVSLGMALGCAEPDVSTIDNDGDVGEYSQQVQLHGMLSDVESGAVSFQIIKNGAVAAQFDADENGDVYIDREMLTEGTLLTATSVGYAPAYTQIASPELSDIYGFLLDPLQEIGEADATIVPASSFMPGDVDNFELLALDAKLDDPTRTTALSAGQEVIAMRYYEGAQAKSIYIESEFELTSDKVTAFAFDGTTLQQIWTREGTVLGGEGAALENTVLGIEGSPTIADPVEHQAAVVTVDVEDIAEQFEHGVWIGLVGEKAPSARNHSSGLTDCTSQPRSCAQSSKIVFSANLCGINSSVKYTLSSSVSLSVSATYMGVGVSGSATLSQGFEYTFPAYSRQDLYLKVRTCNYRTCGLTACTTSASFSSCGNGGVLGCAYKGAGWYAISGAKSCSTNGVAVHALSC